MKYSHIGIPTDIQQENETFLEEGKLHITDFTSNPYGVEWLRPEPDSPLPRALKTVPHVAFNVDDVDQAVKGKMLLVPPHNPWEGFRAAFIIHKGIPIELVKSDSTEPDNHPGLEYHHVGIPTSKEKKNEKYLKDYKLFHTSFDDNPYGTEWMRYEADCPLPEIVKTVPHVAFKVKDLEEALVGQEILIAPNSPSPGVKVAFILFNGAPVEFLEYSDQ